MAIYEISLPNQDPCFNFDTVLDNSTYYFRVRFNARLNLWVLDLKDRSSEAIINGVPFFSNTELFKYVSMESLPKGTLLPFAVNKAGDADRFNLGLDVKLFYLEES